MLGETGHLIFRPGELGAEPFIQLPENLRIVDIGRDRPVPWILCDNSFSRDYNPRDVPDLYLRFANVGPSPLEIMTFSREYGMAALHSPEDRFSSYSASETLGMRLTDFRVAVSDLQLLLKCADLLTLEKWEELGKLRRRVADASCKFFSLFVRDETGDIFVDTGDLYQTNLKDPIHGAHSLLMWQLNYHIRGIHFLVDLDVGNFPVAWPRTTTFLEAVYAQVMLALQQGRGFGVCPACGRVFTKQRSDKIYCSKSCGSKMRMRRRRSRPTSSRADQVRQPQDQSPVT